MKDLQRLVLEEVKRLGQIAFTAHEDLQRWRETPLTLIESTNLSVALKGAIEKQTSWIHAMFDILDLPEE